MTESNDQVYSERYVAFLDILGFSDIVRESAKSPEQTKELIGILENMANAGKEFFYENVEVDDFRAQSFSDCVIMSEKASPVGLFHLLAAVTDLSVNLLSNGVFVRGGIAKGNLHHSDKVVFGPAMLEAYRLESAIARYPRVLIDKNTHVDYQGGPFALVSGEFTVSPQIKLANDGPPFLDMLQIIRHAEEAGFQNIAKCQNAIQKALDASIYEPKHFEKLQWLAVYWNGVASEIGASRVNFPQMKELSSTSGGA